MPHKRTDIEQDDIALRSLSGCKYKVLQALCNRADSRGLCYPGSEYLADATGYTERSVRRSLEALNELDLIRYARRDGHDPLTRRQLPNVMQINPAYICLPAGFEAEALELWQSLRDQCGNRSAGLWSPGEPTPNNQYHNQHHGSNTRESTPKTNELRKKQAPAADYANLPEGADSSGGNKAKKQNPEGKAGQRAARNNQRSQTAELTGSAAAERPQYANPATINTNLPDAQHERLASDIRQFGIAMPLARGFVVEYGYKRTKAAFEAVREMGSNARQPAAVFRSIVQVRLAEDFALAQQQIFNRRSL
jgi:hypothetical protein